MDVDARIQLFDLKSKYQFMTVPGVDRYNMPLYNVQMEPGSQSIGIFPVYQGFLNPCYINGIQVPMQTEKNWFYNVYPNVLQSQAPIGIGNGSKTNFTFNLPIIFNSTPINTPVEGILRGHIDIAGIISTGSNIDPPTIITTLPSPLQVPSTSIDSAFFLTSLDSNGNNIVVSDSGYFLNQSNYGVLIAPGTAPFGYTGLIGGYSTTLNTINYLTGVVNVTFPAAPAAGVNINASYYLFQTGLPRSLLFYNNVITLRSPPDQQYLVELDAYLSPAAFLNTSAAIPFGYMAEYIARGAARKILSDTGDTEQFMFYEPLFIEQERLVWKRSQRQFTSTRTQTIYSQGINQGQSGFSNIGGASF